MRNGETKLYRGKSIKKISGTRYIVPGYLGYFGSYYEAKDAIDAADAEDKALDAIAERIKLLGGYL